MEPIILFKIKRKLLPDEKEAKALKRKSIWYCLINGELYKRSFSIQLLKCLERTDADYVLREIYEGICGNHIGARTLAIKALRAGYY